MGPAIGAVAAFLFEAVDPTLRSLRDFERLVPEPILSTAPRISKLKLRRRRLRRHWVPATLAGVLLLTVVFFVFRNSVLQDAVAPSKPVYLVDPEEANAP